MNSPLVFGRLSHLFFKRQTRSFFGCRLARYYELRPPNEHDQRKTNAFQNYENIVKTIERTKPLETKSTGILYSARRPKFVTLRFEYSRTDIWILSKDNINTLLTTDWCIPSYIFVQRKEVKKKTTKRTVPLYIEMITNLSHLSRFYFYSEHNVSFKT